MLKRASVDDLVHRFPAYFLFCVGFLLVSVGHWTIIFLAGSITFMSVQR